MGRLNYAQAPALGVPTASPTDVSNQAASTAFVQALVPPGVVLPYAGPIPPTGWLLCDGSAISRTTYARLFTAIGTTYGPGDGTTTFNLPEARGEFIRGLDNGRGVDAGRGLGTAQADTLKEHAHLQPTTTNVGAAAGNVVYASSLWNQAPAGGGMSPAGGTETRPRNIAMNYIIKSQ